MNNDNEWQRLYNILALSPEQELFINCDLFGIDLLCILHDQAVPAIISFRGTKGSYIPIDNAIKFHVEESLIFLHPDEKYPSINLCIQNIGTGFASEITFTGDLSFTPVSLRSNKPLMEIGIFEEGIDYLGPEKKIEFPLFFTYSMDDNMDGFPEQPLNIVTTYKDSVNTKYKESFSLDFKKWKGYNKFEMQPLENIANKLADIASALQGRY